MAVVKVWWPLFLGAGDGSKRRGGDVVVLGKAVLMEVNEVVDVSGAACADERAVPVVSSILTLGTCSLLLNSKWHVYRCGQQRCGLRCAGLLLSPSATGEGIHECTEVLPVRDVILLVDMLVEDPRIDDGKEEDGQELNTSVLHCSMQEAVAEAVCISLINEPKGAAIACHVVWYGPSILPPSNCRSLVVVGQDVKWLLVTPTDHKQFLLG